RNVRLCAAFWALADIRPIGVPLKRTACVQYVQRRTNAARRSPSHAVRLWWDFVRPFVFGSRCQLLQERLCLFQITRAESFSEPPVNWSNQFARLLHLALIAPEASETHCRAEFQQLPLLRARNRKRLAEGGLSRISFVGRTGE